MENIYIEIAIKVNIDYLERITNIFYKLGKFELSIEDPRDLDMSDSINLDVYLDDNIIYTQGEDIGIVKYYLSEKENVSEFLETLKSLLNFENINFEIGVKNILEEDWANNWKKYYKTFKINKNIIVKPEWEKYDVKENEILINIDPGMAFGTGTHETTSLCMKLIYKYMEKGYFVYDVGTGSGILAILASKLNAEKVIAIDLDKVAVSSAIYNVKLNNIANIQVIHGNLLEKAMVKGDLVIVNIIAEVIVLLIPDIVKILNKNGVVILSGIINTRVSMIKEKLYDFNLRIIEEMIDGEWHAFSIKSK